MATGVVIARGLVSELVDCHAHDTVSAMSYRDRSVGKAFAQKTLTLRAIQSFHPVAISRIENFCVARIVRLHATLDISFSDEPRELLAGIDTRAIAFAIGKLGFKFLTGFGVITNVESKSIRGGGKEGKC